MSNPRALRTFTPLQVKEQFLPHRWVKWIVREFRNGQHGPVFFDGRGWLISEQAVAHYQQQHQVCAGDRRPERVSNLVQFRGLTVSD